MRAAIAILLIVLIAPTVSADLVTRNSALDASLLYYEPVPAQPGDLLTVWIQIENSGGLTSNPGTLTIYESPTFSISSEAERVKEFPRIPGRESFLAKVKIRVSKDASEGDHTLTVAIEQQGTQNIIEKDLSIGIQGRSTALSIVSAETSPGEILPGEQLALDITVRNVGETKMRNLNLELGLDDLDLAPASGSNAQTIGSLSTGSTHEFMFELVSFPETEAKAYQLPVTLTYEDEVGNEKTQEETIGVVIGAQPELLVYFDSVDLTTAAREGEVVIRIVNKGLAEIKLMELTVQENEQVMVTSESKTVYVGNIDEDDYESADLTLKVTGDEVTVPVSLSYRDALNRPYEEERALTLRLKEPERSGMAGIWITLAIIVAIALGWFWWKRK